jgi:electron transfer flavoprotein alpha subunit
MATIKTPDHRPQMATVRPKSSQPLERDPYREGRIERVVFSPSAVETRVRVLDMERDVWRFENLEEAHIVVGWGDGGSRSGKLSDL